MEVREPGVEPRAADPRTGGFARRLLLGPTQEEGSEPVTQDLLRERRQTRSRIHDELLQIWRHDGRPSGTLVVRRREAPHKRHALIQPRANSLYMICSASAGVEDCPIIQVSHQLARANALGVTPDNGLDALCGLECNSHVIHLQPLSRPCVVWIHTPCS